MLLVRTWSIKTETLLSTPARKPSARAALNVARVVSRELPLAEASCARVLKSSTTASSGKSETESIAISFFGRAGRYCA